MTSEANHVRLLHRSERAYLRILAQLLSSQGKIAQVLLYKRLATPPSPSPIDPQQQLLIGYIYTTLKMSMFGMASNTARFDDDEPLPPKAAALPPPTQSSSSGHPAAATIALFTEYPAVAASASPSDFAVLVKLRAPPAAPSQIQRAPVDLVAVLDVSGSMAGYKLSLLKQAMCFIIRTLGPSDRLSIVTFSTHARRVLNLCLMSDHGRARAIAAVDSLAIENSTNIKAGLQMGVRVLEERRHKNPVAGLILLSDGQDTDNHSGGHRHLFHGGPHPPISFLPGSTNFMPGQEDYRRLLPTNIVPIHTFGFGTDHDPKIMHGIADASGGTFSFIEAEESIQDAFAMCIGGLLSVVAQQVEVMVSVASSGVLVASVDSGSYRSRVLSHGLAAVIDVGDLYADEEKDFLVHLSIPTKGQQDGATTMALLTIKCSYMNPMAEETVHLEGETAVVRRPDVLSPEDQELNLIVDGQRNRILVAESIKEAQEKAESGNFEGAIGVLTERRSVIQESASAKAGDQLSGWLDAELQELQKRMANTHVYNLSGRAYALSGMSSHKKQRAAGGAVANNAEAFMATEAEAFMAAAQSSVIFGAVGYQTKAMRDMVDKSRQNQPKQG